MRYIELNPVRADMVGDPGDYRWSSYKTHGLGTQAQLWMPHAVYLSLGDNAKDRQNAYRGLISELLEQEVMVKIRHCVNTGLVLGSENLESRLRGRLSNILADRLMACFP